MKRLWLVLLLLAATPPAAAEPVVRIALTVGQRQARVTGEGGLSVKTADGMTLLARHLGTVRLHAGREVQVDGEPRGREVLLVPGAGVFSVGDRRYRGYLKAFLDGRGLTLVNYLCLEEYLNGVLGSEVDPTWPLETLKAQAIAARTYALYMIRHPTGQGGVPRSPEYDMVSTVMDQAYYGKDRESAAARRALAATRGQVLTLPDGRVIKAYYHSHCGGHTSDSQPIFGPDVPPLRGVPDPYCSGYPHSSWSRRFSFAVLARRLRDSGRDVGEVEAFRVEGTDRSGRLEAVTVQGSRGEVRLTGKELRATLGFRELPGTRCRVEVLPGAVRFRGGGWGHGVGMCQWGSYEMGRRGFSAREILAHYYPGTEIRSLEDTR